MFKPHPPMTPERIEETVHMIPESGCWIWPKGVVGGIGYARMTHNGIRDYAHRNSWRVFYGEIPNGLAVLHRCDVPCCVNPKHLFLGTLAENCEDMIRKGRNRWGVNAGLKSYWSIKDLSRLKVARHLCESGVRQLDVVRVTGLSKGTVANIATGKHWFFRKTGGEQWT